MASSSGLDTDTSGSTAVVCLVQGDRLSAAWVGDSRAVLGVKRSAGGGGGQAGRAGDSSSSGDGAWTVAWQTEDHKPDDPQERSRIRAAGGRVSRSIGASGPAGPVRVWLADEDSPGLAMSRALGDMPGRRCGIISTPSCSSCSLPLPKGAGGPGSGSAAAPQQQQAVVLVLASDGVWEFLDSESVVALAGGAGSASEACHRIVRKAASAWLREYGGAYVDDITVAVARFGGRGQGAGG